MLPNWQMGSALWTRLQQEQIEVIAPATVDSVSETATHRCVAIKTAQGMTTLSARLVIAADGAQSVVRDAVGISHRHWDYGQTAIIANALTQKFHDHTAYERFTPQGAIAVLPLTEARVGL